MRHCQVRDVHLSQADGRFIVANAAFQEEVDSAARPLARVVVIR